MLLELKMPANKKFEKNIFGRQYHIKNRCKYSNKQNKLLKCKERQKLEKMVIIV